MSGRGSRGSRGSRGRGGRGGSTPQKVKKTDFETVLKEEKEDQIVIPDGTPIFFLLSNPIFSDVIVKLDSKEIKTHKFILVQLQYFEDKIQDDVITLDLPYGGFQRVLNFLYGKFEPIPEEKLVEMYIVANTIKEPFMLRRVLSRIEGIQKKNIIPFYTLLKKYYQYSSNELKDKVMNEFLLNYSLFVSEKQYYDQFMKLSNEEQIELLVHSEIKEEEEEKEKTESDDEDKKKEKEEVEEEEKEEVIKLPQYGRFLPDLYDILLISKDDKAFQAHKAALGIQSKKLYEMVKDVSELKLDLDSSLIEKLLSFTYNNSQLSPEDLKLLDEAFGILQHTEEEKKKLDDEKLKSKKEIENLKDELSSQKFEWDTKSSAFGSSQHTLINKKTIQVNYVSCYNKIYLGPEIKKNSKVTITVKGSDDSHGYIGLVNESFDKNTCLCLQCPNAFYQNSSGNTCINGNSSSSQKAFKPSSHPTVTMSVDVKKKTITFNGKETHNITGSKWRFVVGKCNSDNVTYTVK